MSLTARQSRPAIDAAIYRPNGTLYQLQPSFHTSWTELEPTVDPRDPREAQVFHTNDLEPEPASISDATIRMDHNAVAFFTIDRLARAFPSFYQTWQEQSWNESYGSPK